MLIVQGDRAINLNHCVSISVVDKKIVATWAIDDLGYSVSIVVATFKTEEKAQMIFSAILKDYADGKKVFYC